MSRYEDILMFMTLKCVSLAFELDRNNSKLMEAQTTLSVVCLCFEYLCHHNDINLISNDFLSKSHKNIGTFSCISKHIVYMNNTLVKYI